MQRPTHKQRNPSGGFTLVEVLVVITIIGILAALLIPAIGGVVARGKETAIAMEVEQISQALEAYKNEYQDYPPDYSDLSVVVRHFRKFAPQISNDDLAVLSVITSDANGNTTATAVNRAEALVLALGGYSDDKRRPLTGAGGPFIIIDPTQPINRQNIRYNVDLTNKLFDMDLGRLTLNNQDFEGPGEISDGIPALLPRGLSQPYIYFDSHTYNLVASGNTVIANGYYGGVDAGGIRPYMTFQQPRAPGGNTYGTKAAAASGFRFQKAETFQVISAGLDDIYGSIFYTDPVNLTGDPVYFIAETGVAVYPNQDAASPAELMFSGVRGFQEADLSPQNTNGQFDNITNFSSGRLDGQLQEI